MRRKSVILGALAGACTALALGITLANGAPAGEKGRLIVREKIANEAGIYEEGAISYLRVRRVSDGRLVLRRSYQGEPIRLSERLPARAYRLISFVRPCDGSCRELDPPTDRCSGRVRVRPRAELRVRIVTNDGSPCRIEA